MEYRNIAQLTKCISCNLHKIPRDVDLVVGIPRSGLLAGSMISLFLNIPITDLNGLVEGRVIGNGQRRIARSTGDILASARKVLVLDDSVGHGTQIRAAKQRILQAKLPYDFIYAAVYVTPESEAEIDIAFEILPWPRLFQWNVMHHEFLARCCLDIDGVLCVDPTKDENDDGDNYRQFLNDAKPLFVPSQEVGWLVTCRLEKYRHLTECWLRRHDIRYKSLVMMDLPNKQARSNYGHGRYKAQIYRNTGASLFIESDAEQAVDIARRAGRPVLCTTTQEMIRPPIVARIPVIARKAPNFLLRKLRNCYNIMHRSRLTPNDIRERPMDNL